MPKVNYDAENQTKLANRILRELRTRGLKQQTLVDIWRIGRSAVSTKMNGQSPITERQVRLFEIAMGMQPGELYIGLEQFKPIGDAEQKTSIAQTVRNELQKNGKTEKYLQEVWGLSGPAVTRKLNGRTAIKQTDIELLEEALHMKPGTILAGNGIVIGSTVNVEQKTTETDEGKIGATAFLEKFRQALSRDVVKALEKYASVIPTEQKTPSGWLTLCVALAPDETQNATK